MTKKIELLGKAHHDALYGLLSREAGQNLYMLGLLQEFGITPAAGRAAFAFWGCFKGSTLEAAVFVGGQGGLVVPSSTPAGGIIDIASHLAGKVKLQTSLGEKPGVDVLVQYLSPTQRPRLSKAQRLYAVSADDLGPFTNPLLRLATDADVPQLVPMAAGALKEMYGYDALAQNGHAFAERVALRVALKRTYVLEENGKLVFKLDLGSRSQSGAELEAPYTIPAERRKGHLTLCLGQISRHLLSSLPRLTLRIDDADTSTAAIARKVGYLGGKNQRLVVVE
ncbi:MAG: DUF4081 domain-containing protein [Myxococcaceae bacterium]|nr:DUF4081 domain-containing protein [Myxococcaceae bacterium]